MPASAPDAERLAFPDGRSASLCPWCKEPVVEYRLRKTSGGSYITLWKQRRCSEHKKDEARKEWNARAYPDIDCPNLDARIPQHIDHLKGILSGEKDLYYRDMLARDVKNVEVRNLLRLANDHLPGYYGGGVSGSC